MQVERPKMADVQALKSHVALYLRLALLRVHGENV